MMIIVYNKNFRQSLLHPHEYYQIHFKIKSTVYRWRLLHLKTIFPGHNPRCA